MVSWPFILGQEEHDPNEIWSVIVIEAIIDYSVN
jgi:hypothetical protein